MLAAAQVIDAIAVRLTGLQLTGERVYPSRAWPLTLQELPAWRVQAEDEDIEPATMHIPPLEKHLLVIELHGIEEAAANLDDDLHALTEQALGALFGTPPPDDDLAALTTRVQLSLRQIKRALQTEGQARVGAVVITLLAEFLVPSGSPGTIA